MLVLKVVISSKLTTKITCYATTWYLKVVIGSKLATKVTCYANTWYLKVVN